MKIRKSEECSCLYPCLHLHCELIFEYPHINSEQFAHSKCVGGFLSNSFRFASTFLVAISSGYSVELFLVFGLWYSNQFTTLFRETRYINFKWMNLISSMSIAGPNEMEPIKSENHWRTNNRLSWNYTRCPWWFRFSPKPCIWFVWHKWHKISNGCSHWLIIEMESNLQMEMKMYEVDDASISWMIIDVKPRNSHHL